jgi:hypothetical protein
LNKDTGDDPSHLVDKEDFTKFLNAFLKIPKKKMVSPPTAYEKALIVARPLGDLKKKTPRKVILPELLNTTTPIKTTKMVSKTKKEGTK